MHAGPRAASAWPSEGRLNGLALGTMVAAPPSGGDSSVRRACPGRLIHKADFERLMSAPVWSRSAHFALHHVAGLPQPASGGGARPARDKLSTELCSKEDSIVDNSALQIWIGAMVPKRHARRAVTRNLLKRQIREAFACHAASMRRGLWLVRLRQPFAPKDFPSARSSRLADAARLELDQLLLRPLGQSGQSGRACRPGARPRKPSDPRAGLVKPG